MIDLDALQRAAEAATPGPWFSQHGYLTIYSMSNGDYGTTCALASPLAVQPGKAAAEANAAYMAAANPAVVLELVAMVRSLESTNRRLHDNLERVETSQLAAIDALRPFARLYKEHHHDKREDQPFYGVGDSLITVGDLRAAVKLTGDAQ